MTDTIIELKNVSKIYKRGIEEIHALQDVSLAVHKGEFISVLGPSGSGKSTLLNIIGCVDRPTAGEASIDGKNITTASDSVLTRIRSRKIGFVFQQFFLIPTLTAMENVQIPGLFAGVPERVRLSRELLESVGLEGRLKHRPAQLSGGEMQRVAIARALVNSPEILVADEPTGNLDTSNAEMIFNLFAELNKKGLTILIVTHNLELAKRCRKIIKMKDGRIEN